MTGPDAKLCDDIACDPSNYTRATGGAEWQRFVLRHRAQVMEVGAERVSVRLFRFASGLCLSTVPVVKFDWVLCLKHTARFSFVYSQFRSWDSPFLESSRKWWAQMPKNAQLTSQPTRFRI